MIITFVKPKDLVSYFLEDPRFQPGHIFDAMANGVRGHVFRGQLDRTWPLIPPAFRPGNPLRTHTPQTPGEGLGEGVDPYMYLGIHIHAELRAVHIFLEQADKLGIPTPLDYRALHKHQTVLDAALHRRDYDWQTPFPDATILPGVALAQHHGVPTRLIDWTESPLVAAYFAAIKGSSLCEAHNRPATTEIAIFILDTYILRKLDNASLVSAPRHINNHLRAQKGVFVVMQKSNAFFLEHRRWPTLEEALGTSVQDRGGLDVVTLPIGEVDALLRLLWRYEITRHHLMPSLDHAASAFAYARTLFKSPSEL